MNEILLVEITTPDEFSAEAFLNWESLGTYLLNFGLVDSTDDLRALKIYNQLVLKDIKIVVYPNYKVI